MDCEESNQLDLVDYLQKLGYSPKKIRYQDYWYLSPLRDEKTPSFKVNRKLNIWYDHGIGKGGTLVDFGILFHNCTVKELLEKLSNQKTPSLFFQPQIAIEKKHPIDRSPSSEGKIMILEDGKIKDPTLTEYLHARKIPLHIAEKYCSEIKFELYKKQHVAIGFKNRGGGYELRNSYFKGSCSPKDISIVGNEDTETLNVFEGFFNFLSFQAELLQNKKLLLLPKPQEQFLVLNSLSFFEINRPFMEKHKGIRLYLDNDTSGIKNCQTALNWSEKYKDMSVGYQKYKDLNEALVNSQEVKIKMHKSPGHRL